MKNRIYALLVLLSLSTQVVAIENEDYYNRQFCSEVS